jgi:hypothetical protein
MKWIISRYDHDVSYLPEYTDDFVLYDRSEKPLDGSIVVPNIGSDIYDKFTYIIDNYDNLPDVAVYTKANIFQYISKDEFDLIKDSETFTPILTQRHKTALPVSYYANGLYHEINNYWYLGPHPAKHAREIRDIFNMDARQYNAFAPGSNYIVPKKNILKHTKEFYVKLRSFLDWGIYPGDAQLTERNLYYLWQ